MTDWRSSLRSDPIPWLLEGGSAPVRYRVLTELLDRGPDDPEVQAAQQEALVHGPALDIQKKQRKDGTWGGAIHAGDPRKFQPCTENAMLRLFEFGWDRQMKPVRSAAKALRSLLSAKRDLKFYEFAKAIKGDARREAYYRWFLKILAHGLLLRAGYQDDRARRLTLELLDLTAGFVDDPTSRSPVEEIGANLPLIRSDAWRDGYVFLPDTYLMRIFAHSPWLLQGEMAKMRLKKVFDYVLSPTYQQIAPELGLVRTAKGAFPRLHGIRLRPLEHYHKKGDLDELLVHLELFARLGLINRYPLLMAQLEWLQSQQGKDGKWNFSTKLMHDTSRWTTLLRIEKDWRSQARKEADLTFRVLLIVKNQWERQVPMLDRRDDGYPI